MEDENNNTAAASTAPTSPPLPSTTTTTTTPKTDDPRLGSIITPGTDGDVVIIGFPRDEGTIRNGGRAGGRFAPSSFRQFLSKMGAVRNLEFGINLAKHIRITDAGDVGGNNKSLEETHEELRALVATVLKRGGIPFVVGGSNDQSSSNGLALLDVVEENVSVINIDAHLDVRPRVNGQNGEQQIHSGCPFRDLLEDGRLDGKQFCEFAAQGSQCSAAHVEYVEGKGGQIVWLQHLPGRMLHDQTNNNNNTTTVGTVFKNCLDGLVKSQHSANNNPHHPPALFVSFDIDAISGADCPGVSCPSTVGLSAQEALEICFVAGSNPATRLFDMSEMNPLVEAYRTPRLAVNMFYMFCVGLAMQKA